MKSIANTPIAAQNAAKNSHEESELASVEEELGPTALWWLVAAVRVGAPALPFESSSQGRVLGFSWAKMAWSGTTASRSWIWTARADCDCARAPAVSARCPVFAQPNGGPHSTTADSSRGHRRFLRVIAMYLDIHRGSRYRAVVVRHRGDATTTFQTRVAEPPELDPGEILGWSGGPACRIGAAGHTAGRQHDNRPGEGAPPLSMPGRVWMGAGACSRPIELKLVVAPSGGRWGPLGFAPATWATATLRWARAWRPSLRGAGSLPGSRAVSWSS